MGGLFPQTQESQQKVCQDIGSESNIFADWAASRQGCTVGGQSSSVRDKASDKDKERVLKNQNIIWEALKKNRMFDGNKELKEFIMTLTGTLIFGEDSEITPLPARTTDRDILRAIMEGGTAKIYHCNDSDKCLKVVADANVTIARDKALKSQITKLLTSIQNKAVSDTPLDAREQEMAREASNRAESALHGFSSSIASAWNSLSQFGSNRGSSDSVTGGADSTMSAQDSMMASRMRSAVESYAKAHNISNEQATQELASRSTRASAGMYGDAHAEWGGKPKILGVGGGLGVKGGGRAGIDWEDNDAHTASSNTQSSHNARHDIDARATQDFKEASDYFTSRKVSESGSHTDNNADSRVDQLSAALNSAKQSYDQYTTNMTRSHEYAEMASRTESMSGQMSEDLSQQFAQYVMKHAPQDAEAILTNTSSPEIAERRRAMAWSFVLEQVQPGVDNAWRESRGDIGKGMESVPSGGGSQDIIADHQGHQAIIEQRTQDSNIRNDVKHQVDNMVTEYKGNIGDTQNSIRGEENIVRGQYSELQNHHKTEALSQNNKYNEEKSAQERMPGADSPQELMKRAKEYQDKYK